MNVTILSQVPLFATLPAEAWAQLAARLPEQDYAVGTILFHEGDYGDRFYIVLSGQVAIIKAIGTPEERLVGLRTTGDFIGEMSLLSHSSMRTATTRIEQAARLIEISRAEFNQLLHQYPLLAYEMLRVLSERLGAANNLAIHDLQQKNHQLAQAYAELQVAQAQLIEQEALRRELQVAREIQESMLPQELPHVEGIELGARMLPARTIGGDFYDAFVLGSHQIGIAIGDVCGKGVPSALLMARICSLLRAEAMRAESPAAALLAVNQHLLSRSAEGMFVTVLYGILDCQNQQFSYARAGHEYPVIWNTAGYLALPHGLGHPLGLIENPAIDTQVITMPPGSSLLLISDGVTEAMNTQQQEYGIERLYATISGLLPNTAQSLCDQLIATLTGYQGEAAQADDITLLAAQLT